MARVEYKFALNKTPETKAAEIFKPSSRSWGCQCQFTVPKRRLWSFSRSFLTNFWKGRQAFEFKTFPFSSRIFGEFVDVFSPWQRTSSWLTFRTHLLLILFFFIFKAFWRIFGWMFAWILKRYFGKKLFESEVMMVMEVMKVEERFLLLNGLWRHSLHWFQFKYPFII